MAYPTPTPVTMADLKDLGSAINAMGTGTRAATPRTRPTDVITVQVTDSEPAPAFFLVMVCGGR